jgi:hypothetical protein
MRNLVVSLMMDYSIILVAGAVSAGIFLAWFELYAGKLGMSGKEIMDRYVDLQRRLRK